MTNNRRQVGGTTTCETADITTTTTTNTATTPTTSALLKESRQLLLKQQLKLKLNINVSEMMDNIRRNNVDDKQQTQITKEHDGLNDGLQNEEFGYEKDLNKLDTVTTVPQLQQKFNKFNIIDEAAIKTNITTKTTSSKPGVAAATTSSTTTTLTSSSLNRSLTQQQQQNTALAKFNRIIDNTVPVTNTYNYQQHVAETLTAKSSQQHPHYPRQQQHEHQEMPILSDSLKRRLANKNHQQYYSNNININNYNDNSTDLIVNNSKINFSSTTAAATKAALSTETAAPIATAGAGHSLIKSTAIEVASTSKAAANKIAGGLAKMLPALASSSQQEQELETLEKIRNKSLAPEEDEQMERNDVHYLLKQLNSFSDIEEIEIVDMKQKQRQLQQQQQEQQQYIKEKQFVKADNNQQQHVEKLATLNFTEYQHQHVDSVKQQHVVEQVLSTNLHTQHVSTEHLVTETHKQQQQQQVVAVDVGLQMYTTESKQHYHETTLTSPTATSLVIYSPSSQSHKGIRRYASQDEQNACGAIDSYHTHPHHHQQQPLHQQEHPLLPHHHHYLHHQPHYVHLPHEHCSADSMLDTASGQTASADPLNLQQFVDDYIFQSCHYLETNNFVANYRTAMVESSSHEFRPSTTTTTNTTRTSNEEFYEEEEAGYVEDHSSAHSFELHEIEPPTVICKAPAPLPAVTMQQQTQHHHQEYIMETRLCSSGVQTDLTASSLAQSFSLSSSLSSSEKQKRRQPLFKCCYTPLDRWREKRSQQSQIQKRTKSATTTAAAAATTATVKFSDKTIEHHPVQYPQQQHHHQQQFQQLTTKNTTVAIVGGPSYTGSSTAIVTSCIATTGSSSLATAITLSSSHTQSHHSTSQSQTHSQQTQSLSKNINNHHNNKNNDNAPYAV